MSDPVYELDTIDSLKKRIRELEQAEKALTESRRALEQSERRFREIIEDVSGVSIQGYNEDRRVTFWNSASEELYGYSEEEARGLRLEDLIIPVEMRQDVINLHARWMTDDEKIDAAELILRAKDGSDVPVYSSHTMINTDQGKEMFCIDVDLGRIKKVERELEKSRQMLDLLNTHSSAFVSIFDEKGRFLFVSQSYHNLGYHPDKLVGVEGFTIVDKRDAPRLRRMLALVSKGYRKDTVLEFRVVDSRGEAHLIRGSFNIVFDDPNEALRVICVFEDITELRQAQTDKLAAMSRAAESEKLALVGKISGQMAHDFNNVLGVILGNAELASLSCEDERIADKLNLIRDQSLRGRNLTRNLVAFARDQEPEQEFFSMEEKIRLVLKLMARDLGDVKVICQFESNLPDVMADPGMLEHALVNLLQNAVHATSKEEKPEIRLHLYQLRDHIVLTISDNGCGISREELPQVFEPSFSLKGSRDHNGCYSPEIQGTGYGMTSARKYVQQHGGDIRIQSELHTGTCIEITLPVLDNHSKPNKAQMLSNETVYKNRSVLVIEDEAAISDVQKQVLEAEPCQHEVKIAANGQAALELMATREFDCICIDYVLPGKYNGLDLYRQIRQSGSMVPVLFISGNLEFIESIRDLKAGDRHVAHLAKPFESINLVREVDYILKQAQST